MFASSRCGVAALLIYVFALWAVKFCVGKPEMECRVHQDLYGTILEQLAPFMPSISQQQLDLVVQLYRELKQEDQSGYNYAATKTLPVEDTSFPWSHHSLVKLIMSNGTFYLPGGHLPKSTDGFSFTAHW